MSRSKTASRTVATTMRRQQAMDLRAQGYSLAEVADALGITRQSAWELLTKSIHDYNASTAERAEEYIETNHARLEKLIKAHMPAATDPTDRNTYAAANTVLKSVNEQNKLRGLHAPTKAELSGPNGGPIQSVEAAFDVSKLSTDELTALQELMRKAQG